MALRATTAKETALFSEQCVSMGRRGGIGMGPQAEPWWRQAEADLRTAEVSWQAGLYYAVSWFAQQAAEKGLKALYVEQHQRVPPYTHDLKLLAGLVTAPPSVETDIIALVPAFDMARYPDAMGRAPVDAVTAGDASTHLAIAQRTLQWIVSVLGVP
jgi:HEPN domain-containing protein